MTSLTEFKCAEKGLILRISDFNVKYHPSLLKATLSTLGEEDELVQPLQITLQKVDVEDENVVNLENIRLCQGMVETRELFSAVARKNAWQYVSVEKVCFNWVYRSRKCSKIGGSLCKPCETFFKSLQESKKSILKDESHQEKEILQIQIEESKVESPEIITDDVKVEVDFKSEVENDDKDSIYSAGGEYIKPCPFCDAAFNVSESIDEFYKHLRELHSSVENSPKIKQALKGYKKFYKYCGPCKKSFSSHGNWNYHQFAKHTEGAVKTKVCHICDKEFSLWGLPTHMRFVHGSNDEIPCQQCDLVFKNEVYMQRHVRKVHSNLSYTCDECGKSFRTKAALKIHISGVHLKEKKYKCEQCEYRAISKQKLKVHALCMHTSYEDKPLSCDKCLYKCARNDSLRFHMQNQHGEKIK